MFKLCSHVFLNELEVKRGASLKMSSRREFGALFILVISSVKLGLWPLWSLSVTTVVFLGVVHPSILCLELEGHPKHRRWTKWRDLCCGQVESRWSGARRLWGRVAPIKDLVRYYSVVSAPSPSPDIFLTVGLSVEPSFPRDSPVMFGWSARDDMDS